MAQPGRAEFAVEHHQRITEALEREDLAGTEEMLRGHLDRHTDELDRYLPQARRPGRPDRRWARFAKSGPHRGHRPGSGAGRTRG